MQSKLLARASGIELSDQTIAKYLKNKTKTQVVKLGKVVPVELRYETIVVEDGKLHIYRDVYDQNTNTEENLRAVLEANGVRFEALSSDEKAQAMEALNALSNHPTKPALPKPAVGKGENLAKTAANAIERKTEAERQRKLRNQKEIVIEIATLSGKGYPAPVNLDTGSGVKTN